MKHSDDVDSILAKNVHDQIGQARYRELTRTGLDIEPAGVREKRKRTVNGAMDAGQ